MIGAFCGGRTPVISFLLALLMATWNATSSTATPRSDALFETANKAREKDNFREAMHYFKLEAIADPRDARAYDGMADMDLQLGRPDLSIKNATIALKLNPRAASTLVLRARAYFASEDYEASLSDVNKAIAIDPSLWLPYSMRSKLEVDKKQWQTALSDCSRAIELRTNREGEAGIGTLWDDRATILCKLEKWSQAIDDYTRTIKYTGDYNRRMRAYTRRAECYEKIGRHDLAEKDTKIAKKAIQADWDIILEK